VHLDLFDKLQKLKGK